MNFYCVRTSKAGDLIVVKVPEGEADEIAYVKAETKERGRDFLACYLYPWKKGDKVWY